MFRRGIRNNAKYTVLFRVDWEAVVKGDLSKMLELMEPFGDVMIGFVGPSLNDLGTQLGVTPFCLPPGPLSFHTNRHNPSLT